MLAFAILPHVVATLCLNRWSARNFEDFSPASVFLAETLSRNWNVSDRIFLAFLDCGCKSAGFVLRVEGYLGFKMSLPSLVSTVVPGVSFPNSYGCWCCLTSQFSFSLPGKTVARQRASNNSQVANVCL